MTRTLLALALALWAAPLHAQSQIAEYWTLLGHADMVNSRGQRLGNFCAVVQQDRANWHRFKIRDDGDTGDPIFASREARAQIGSRCTIQPGYEYIANEVLRGTPRYIWVRIYALGGRITEVLITEGAG